jgi:lysophospholipase L1-like esterase
MSWQADLATLSADAISKLSAMRRARTMNASAECLRHARVDGASGYDSRTSTGRIISRLRPEFDCDDHLHPSDAGYEAMAKLIDLSLFT